MTEIEQVTTWLEKLRNDQKWLRRKYQRNYSRRAIAQVGINATLIVQGEQWLVDQRTKTQLKT